jgi:uncharacterized repeat protein (TIGR03803 family)
MQATRSAASVSRVVALVAAFVLLGSGLAVCQTESTLFSFPDGNNGYPLAGLIADANGALYGTTLGNQQNNGTVFQLVQQGGSWTENVLYNFTCCQKGDGENPKGGLIFDKAGNLYGTTYQSPITGGGIVFELSPPKTKGGAWTETTLHTFQTGGQGTDGSNPQANLVMDGKGALYGTTFGGGIGPGLGTVFKLTPPAKQGGKWTERVLYTFTGGSDGGGIASDVVFDKKGALYGTALGGGTSNAGVVFKLTPPQHGGSWTESVLYNFTGGKDGGGPEAGLILDRAGNLYGTTVFGGNGGNNCQNTCGVVFELSPNGGSWTEKVLHNFTGKKDGGYPVFAKLVLRNNGALYSVTFEGGEPPDCSNQLSGCGVVFKLKPPATKGGKWSEKVLYTFTNTTDGALPTGTLIFDKKGNLYGTTEISNSYQGFGTVFEITP